MREMWKVKQYRRAGAIKEEKKKRIWRPREPEGDFERRARALACTSESDINSIQLSRSISSKCNPEVRYTKDSYTVSSVNPPFWKRSEPSPRRISSVNAIKNKKTRKTRRRESRRGERGGARIRKRKGRLKGPVFNGKRTLRALRQTHRASSLPFHACRFVSGSFARSGFRG